MSNSETTISTTTSGENESTPDPVVVAGGTSNLDATTINHTERLTRLEDSFGGMSSRMEGVETSQSELTNSVQSLSESVRTSLEGLTSTIAGLGGKLSEGASSVADAITEPVEEVVEDVAPTIKEHAFFRKWGS